MGAPEEAFERIQKWWAASMLSEPTPDLLVAQATVYPGGWTGPRIDFDLHRADIEALLNELAAMRTLAEGLLGEAIDLDEFRRRYPLTSPADREPGT